MNLLSAGISPDRATAEDASRGGTAKFAELHIGDDRGGVIPAGGQGPPQRPEGPVCRGSQGLSWPVGCVRVLLRHRWRWAVAEVIAGAARTRSKAPRRKAGKTRYLVPDYFTIHSSVCGGARNRAPWAVTTTSSSMPTAPNPGTLSEGSRVKTWLSAAAMNGVFR